MRTRHLRSAAALAAAGLILGACSGGSSGSGGAGGSATKGGTVFILTQGEKITHLDPQRNYTNTDMAFATSTMHRTLTTYKFASGADGSAIAPDLATDLGTSSADAKTWSFTLRDGITFEDGAAITCADVAYGVSRTFAQDVVADGPTYAINYLDIAGDYPGPYTATPDQQKAFDAAASCSSDNKTITFKLKVPVADFNYTVALPSFSPVPKAADKGEGYDLAPVSSGPYKIESYEVGKQLVLVRNDKWDQKSDPIRHAYPDKFVYQFALDPVVINERLIADAGDDQFAVSPDGVLPENLQTVFTDDRFKDRREDGFDPFVTYSAFNVKAVSCLEVRQAYWLALNRDATRAATGGPYSGDFADGFIKPALAQDYSPTKLLEGLNKDGKPNVEAAKAKMEEAKTKCPDVYKRVTTDGLKLDFGDTPTAQKVVAIVVEAEKAAGIVVQPVPLETSAYYPTVMNPETQGDLSGAGWAPDWANASTVLPELFADGGFNLSQNSEDPAYAAFQEKVDKARAETDRAKQSAMWKELNQYVVDQVWALPSIFTKSQDLWGSKVGNAYRWSAYGCLNFGDLSAKA